LLRVKKDDARQKETYGKVGSLSCAREKVSGKLPGAQRHKDRFSHSDPHQGINGFKLALMHMVSRTICLTPIYEIESNIFSFARSLLNVP
jgi:hypothetical protein